MGRAGKGILDLVREQLDARGWRAGRVAGLPNCHTCEAEFSPYVDVFNVLKRRTGEYQVEAFFGVIHRGFEEQWVRENPGVANRYWAGVHSSNFPELKWAVCIPVDDEPGPLVEELADAFVVLLGKFPRDMKALRDAMAVGTIAGRPFPFFALPDNRGKFEAFVEFSSAVNRL
jgi:hypothetical protein